MTLRSQYANHAYKSDEILTLSPVGLVVRVQTKAVQSLKRAGDLLAAGRVTESRSEVNRARSLIAELRGALDHEAGGEIAAELDRIYEYLIASFLRAGGTPNAAVLNSAAGILDRIRDGFDVVLSQESAATP